MRQPRERRAARGLLAALSLLAALCVPAALPGPARGQELRVSRNQFAEQAQRPEARLSGAEAVTVRDERWTVQGAATLRVVSPDPQAAAVLRLRALEPGAPGAAASGAADPGAPLRLTVIVIAEEGARRYEYKGEGELLRDGARVPQRLFRVGERGLESGLAGAAGRVSELVIQDDGDAELRLRQQGDVLELQVLPLSYGGTPSGEGRPRVLSRPLRFADARLLATGYTDNALGELWLGDLLAAKVNGFFPERGGALLARGLVTAQAWRGDTLSLWAEGGVGYYRLEDAATGLVSDAVRAAGGVTLHWRYAGWGAAAHVGLVGDTSVLTLFAGWQAWRHVALLLGWQSFESRSGFGLGAGIGF
ncbi:MAG TPA: hypothetical protein VGC20_11825 [bacterium]